MTNRSLRLAMLAIAFSLLAACASTPDPVDPVEQRFLADNQAASAALIDGDVPTAVALWTPWADQGRSEAQFGMGVVYEVTAAGSSEGMDAALEWYRRAGEQGHTPANLRRAQLLTQLGEVEAATAAYRHAASCGDMTAILVLNARGIDPAPDAPCLEGLASYAGGSGSIDGREAVLHDTHRDAVYREPDRGSWSGVRETHVNPAPSHNIRVRSSAER